MTPSSLESIDPLPYEAPADASKGPHVQPNGREYLVEHNGSVFVALSRSEAEAIAHRMAAPRAGDRNRSILGRR
jgi:hypothetical protein